MLPFFVVAFLFYLLEFSTLKFEILLRNIPVLSSGNTSVRTYYILSLPPSLWYIVCLLSVSINLPLM